MEIIEEERVKSDKLLKDAFMRKNQQCNIRLISFNIIELLHI